MSVQWPVDTTGSGLDDLSYIKRVRTMLRDRPRYADEQFNGDGTKTTFLCTQLLINDDDYLSVEVNGLQVPVTSSESNLNNTNCWVEYETGRLVFGTAPSAGTANVIIHKNQVDVRDAEVIDLLNSGMLAAWPAIWRVYVDTSIQIQVNVWDYQLPPMFNLYPDMYILNMELQDVPSGVPEPFVQQPVWEKVGNSLIKILDSQAFTVGATIRLTYAGPYTSLTQLEGRVGNLPVLYAVGMLMAGREARRSRTDTMSATAEGSSNPSGTLTSSAGFYMNQFYSERQQLSRPIPMPPIGSTYRH